MNRDSYRLHRTGDSQPTASGAVAAGKVASKLPFFSFKREIASSLSHPRLASSLALAVSDILEAKRTQPPPSHPKPLSHLPSMGMALSPGAGQVTLNMYALSLSSSPLPHRPVSSFPQTNNYPPSVWAIPRLPMPPSFMATRSGRFIEWCYATRAPTLPWPSAGHFRLDNPIT